MGTINIQSKRKDVTKKGVTRVYDLYSRAELRKFSPVILGLADIGRKARRIDVIAAQFDLSGFTDFCSQIDSHLSMPRFLKEFIDWIFENIQSEFTEKRFRQGVLLYSDLPFFAKFTGDGVLFLWNTENMDMRKICNVLIIAGNLCSRYRRVFVPAARKYLSDVPRGLRCGVACGMVCSVGNGEDYVGSCINMASRLLKTSNIGICCSRRGMDFEEGMRSETAELYITKRVSIRGIGKDQLVIVRKAEFEKLLKRDKAVFKDV